MPNSRPRAAWLTRWSVRTRILTSILLVAALGLTVAGLVAYAIQRERVISELDTQLTVTSEQVRFIATDTGADTSEDLLRLIMARVVPHHNESSVGVMEGAARFVPGVSTTFLLLDFPQVIERIVAEVQTQNASVVGTYRGEGATLRYLAVPVKINTDSQSGIFITAIDVEAELAGLTAAFRTYTWVAVGALLTIGVVGWFVAGRLLRPLRDLEQTAASISLSDLSQRIAVTGNDDVSRLGATVNTMLDRLEAAVQAQGQLLDDVRHELRTPLTIIRGHLELLDPTQPEEVTHTKALVIDEIDRMAQLVSDIEVLADWGASPSGAVGEQGEKLNSRGRINPKPTDIADLTQQVFEKASIEPNHLWELNNQAPIVLTVDAQRITQAWLQLVDNAVKHTPEGTTVAIGSRELEGQVELYVADTGPGIPEEALTRIFERFGRAEVSRGRRGSGLGLAIVQAIMRAHGGEVEVQNQFPGARFTMRLPNQLGQQDPA